MVNSVCDLPTQRHTPLDDAFFRYTGARARAHADTHARIHINTHTHAQTHAHTYKRICVHEHAFCSIRLNHHHHHLSLNREVRLGTTDDFTISFLHFPLFSTAFWELANSRPVHSLMLSSYHFICLSCLLPPFTVP